LYSCRLLVCEAETSQQSIQMGRHTVHVCIHYTHKPHTLHTNTLHTHSTNYTETCNTHMYCTHTHTRKNTNTHTCTAKTCICSQWRISGRYNAWFSFFVWSLPFLQAIISVFLWPNGLQYLMFCYQETRVLPNTSKTNVYIIHTPACKNQIWYLIDIVTCRSMHYNPLLALLLLIFLSLAKSLVTGALVTYSTNNSILMPLILRQLALI